MQKACRASRQVFILPKPRIVFEHTDELSEPDPRRRIAMFSKANGPHRNSSDHRVRGTHQASAHEITGVIRKRAVKGTGGYYVWLFLTAAGLFGAMGYLKLRAAFAVLSSFASSAMGVMLFAIVLTIGVCGSLACAVIWWACKRELLDTVQHRESMRRYLAVQGSHARKAEAKNRRAA